MIDDVEHCNNQGDNFYPILASVGRRAWRNSSQRCSPSLPKGTISPDPEPHRQRIAQWMDLCTPVVLPFLPMQSVLHFRFLNIDLDKKVNTKGFLLQRSLRILEGNLAEQHRRSSHPAHTKEKTSDLGLSVRSLPKLSNPDKPIPTKPACHLPFKAKNRVSGKNYATASHSFKGARCMRS